MVDGMWVLPSHSGMNNIRLGDQYGDYKIIDFYTVNNILYCTIQCIKCGHIIGGICIDSYYNPFLLNDFKHSFKHCQEDYLIHETQLFADYRYIPNTMIKNIQTKWGKVNYGKVKCTKCGHIREININDIKNYRLYHSPKVCKEDFYIDKLIGKVIDDYTILSIDGRNKYDRFIISLKCNVCGHIISNVETSRLTKNYKFTHSFQRCQKDYLNSVKMKGDYVFHRLLDIDKCKKRMCEIKCTKCGHIKQVYCDHLELCEYKHWGMNCGEDYYKEEIGKIYGDMKVIDFVMEDYKSPDGCIRKRPRYKVQCMKCGIIKMMLFNNMKRIGHGTKHDDFEHIISQYIPNRSDKIYRGFYDRWKGMHDRCYDITNNHYKNYGGRGIKVCDRWKDNFVNFFYDMWESYKSHVQQYSLSNTTIDRIDNDSDYTPNNTRWATNEEQSNNTRRNVYFKVYDEKTKKLIGEYIGLNKYLRENGMDESDRSNIRTRLNRIVNQDTYKGRIYEKIYD